MTFQAYLNNITNVINKFINILAKTYNSIFDNYLFKTILFIIILYLIIEYFGEILAFIRNIFSMKKEAGKNKVNSNTDIE